jgi:hypothetical protein
MSKLLNVKDFLGIETYLNGEPIFLAMGNRKTGLTFKSLIDQIDVYCLRRDYFTKNKEGTKAYNDAFDTILLWAKSGEIKWNMIVGNLNTERENEIRVIRVGIYTDALPGSCPFA